MADSPFHNLYKTVPVLSGEKESRFVKIFPDSVEDDLQAAVFSRSLKDFHDFFALSYTWGSSLKSQATIRLNGFRCGITDNLYLGLKKLRARLCKSSPATVWIDSISINQDDTDEKDVQVPMMKDISSSASRVVIWLGNRDETLDRTMEFMERIPPNIDNLPPIFSGPDDLATLCRVADLEPTSIVKGLLDICNRPWFRRTWILQEVALPTLTPLVLCGNSLICWDCFIHSLGYLRYFFIEDINAQRLPPSVQNEIQGSERLDPHTPNVTYHMRDYYRHWKDILGGVPFMSLLEDTALCLSTNPRDKIYGFLALADDES
ncbi:heterokaryon incompatibility protein-domain-containing protein [Thelonectria olida]|uniref:Heterokaryon incompatibility protein-domain-containing protein n=1 Tax=Thelonectria olida TaxID=1576542 RepID=A0A9P9AQD4_9HYPO|nr:heterokaryon incompatibility protein-domain-containing protein [Thelonectria olida]